MIPTPGMSQQDSSVAQQAQSKYVRVWKGTLSGERQGESVFITKLEGYRSASASERLAANWPPDMQIVRLISQDHMNNKQYVGKADFLVFHAMYPHGLLCQMQEKKLCAVIQLPSQTLLLSVSNKACRLIGMLFPGDMVDFKAQIPTQPQQQQQMQQQQATTPADATAAVSAATDATALAAASTATDATTAAAVTNATAATTYAAQQQPQLTQQQQMVGAGIGQAYIQGGGRSQLVSQGQVSSQVPPNLPGGGGQGQVSSQVPPNLPGGGGFMG